MGYAICRFNKDEGCNEISGTHWIMYFADIDKMVNVPNMWKHYMINHNVQPTIEERELKIGRAHV
jgi:hypothetical protein